MSEWLREVIRDPITDDASSARVVAIAFAGTGILVALILVATAAAVALRGGPEAEGIIRSLMIAGGATSVVGILVAGGAVAIINRTKPPKNTPVAPDHEG